MNESSRTFKVFTLKIRDLIRNPSQVLIRKRHIEIDRIWREITLEDIWSVLKNGKITRIRHSDFTLFWSGHDEESRTLELLCSLVTLDGTETLVINDAHYLKIGTAYSPDLNDDETLKKWLQNNPDYERDLKTKGVRKKVKRH